MVSKLSHQMRAAWIRLQLESPAWVQRTLLPKLHAAKELGRVRPTLVVQRLSGRNAGGPLCVDYAGLEHRPGMADALFDDEPIVQSTRRAAAWRIGALAAASNADLTVVAGSSYLVNRLPRQDVLVLPLLVDMTLDVSGDWQAVRRRLHEGVRRHELRLVRKYAYEYEISARDSDFEMFYRKMYAPTMRDRKGRLVALQPFIVAREYFRHSHLLYLVRREGEAVAGMLATRRGRTIRAELMGVRDADETLIHEGALGAAFYAVVHWANQNGYAEVDFGGAVPRLRNGVFQNKRKWGAVVSPSPMIYKRIWLKAQRDTPAVRHFFRETPLITVEPDGRFHGLIAVDDPASVAEETRRDWDVRYATPGLADLRVCVIGDLIAGQSAARSDAPPFAQPALALPTLNED